MIKINNTYYAASRIVSISPVMRCYDATKGFWMFTVKINLSDGLYLLEEDVFFDEENVNNVEYHRDRLANRITEYSK